ncbi:ROK family protein [Parafrigoribacterium mesophilum]|uniref:ROK family protein n=1 Tax=Parafrigoribacterium mesophilum TaxID=433646 RepID=UPI0031FBDCEF
MKYWAGVDVGGTKTHTIVVDVDGNIAAQTRAPTGKGGDRVVDAVVGGLVDVAAKLRIEVDGFAGVGVGIPGAVDARAGTVSHALNIGVEHLDLRARIRHRLGVCITLENDVKAATLGASKQMNHPTTPLAYLNLGTGLAAGLVLGGRLWRGNSGTAGEIGHIPVDPQGHLCSCGQRGCLETSASGAAVAREWPTKSGSAITSLLSAVEDGDPAASRVLGVVADRVATAVKVLVLTVDVGTVVLGGGLASAGDRLRSAVATSLDRDALDSVFLASLGLSNRVVLVPDPATVGALGAAIVGSEGSGDY